MSLKEVEKDVASLTDKLKFVQRSVSDIKDEIVVMKSAVDDFRSMVSKDMRLIVTQLNEQRSKLQE